MGNFLSAPRTEKDTSTGEGNGLVTGISSMQGWRAHMEDAHTLQEQLPFCPPFSFFAVYDGHGGTLAAEYSARNMLDAIRSSPQFKSFAGKEETMEPNIIGEALIHSYFEVDSQIREQPEVGRGDDHSGCTAISAMVTPTHIIVANTGDSRGVMGKKGDCIPLSFDHKPNNEIEKNRIENAGGVVRIKRVNGDLAVSRALGDFMYKDRSDLPPQEQQVTALPDISIQSRCGEEEFIVLACDGIWDVMNNEDVCEFIRELLRSGERNMGLIAEELLDHCLSLGSRDNMTALIVALPGISYGNGKGVQGIREERVMRQKLKEQKEQDQLNSKA